MSDKEAITPYRTPAVVVPSLPKFGLIREKKPAPPHDCDPPSLLWHTITFRPIHHNSLWRCECGIVHRVIFYVDTTKWKAKWKALDDAYGKQLWEANGGIYE